MALGGNSHKMAAAARPDEVGLVGARGGVIKRSERKASDQECTSLRERSDDVALLFGVAVLEAPIVTGLLVA